MITQAVDAGDTTLGALERRLGILERRYRRLRAGAGALVVVALLPYVTGALTGVSAAVVPMRTERLDFVHGDTIVASLVALPRGQVKGTSPAANATAIGVLNPAGKLNAAIITDRGGGNYYVYNNAETVLGDLFTDSVSGGISLSSAAGRHVVTLRGLKTGGNLDVYNDSGKSAVQIGVLDTVLGGAIALRDRNGNDMAYAGMQASGAGGTVSVFHRGGNVAAKLFARTDSSGEVQVRSAFDHTAISMFASKAGNGTVQLRDRRDTIVTEMGTFNDGSGPYVSLYGGPTARALVTIYGDADGGNLDLYDKNHSRVGSFVTKTGSTGGDLTVYGASGKMAGALFARNDGAGGDLAVYGRGDTAVAHLIARGDGLGGDLTLYRSDGHRAAGMFAGTYGGTFRIYGRTENSLAEIFARDDAAGADFQIFNTDGKRLAGLFASPTGTGRLQLYDASGTVKYSVP